MKLLQFIFPFLFERNGFTGERELSFRRLILVGALLTALIVGMVIIHMMQAPVTYERTL